MLFNSYGFIFAFLPITFVGYFLVAQAGRREPSVLWLASASLVFYSWWNVRYLPLILSSILINFVCSRILQSPEMRERFGFSKFFILMTAITFNVLLLCYFKYADFFIENTNALFTSNMPLLHVALPLAISFFTLQQIAYQIDCYDGLVKSKPGIAEYTLFVSFFPQLIAGPIVHQKEMMPQFLDDTNRQINPNNIAAGVLLFSVGLFKKVFVADTFAVWATNGFDGATTLNLLEAWLTSLSYTFQLYFDFSGYTDMAIGLALLFNIRLPNNFDSPFKSKGMIEFWQRWHMTLSRFITAYMYTPLLRSFNKITFPKAMFATFLTMAIAGLWHGAAWTFLIFGVLHGLGIVVNHLWRKTKMPLSPILSWFITFNFVNITFVFFRATSWDSALKVLSGMIGFNGIVLPDKLEERFQFLNRFSIEFGHAFERVSGSWTACLWVIAALISVHALKNTLELKDNFEPSVRTLSLNVVCLTLSLLSLSNATEFLYFNF